MSSSDTDITPERLNTVALRLQRVSAPSEPIFLGVGDKLAQGIEVIRSLTQDLASLSRDAGNEAVSSSVESLHAAANQVVALTSGLTSEKSSFDTLSTAASGGSRWIGGLKKTIGEVSIVGTNAKIQAAQLEGAGADFAAFVNEIGRLAQMATDGLERLAKRHASLTKLIAGALDSEKTFAAVHGQALTDVGRRLDNSLQVMEEGRRQAEDTLVEIGRRSDHVARQLAAAVKSLQINDITRQRLEHVTDALTKGGQLIEGRATWATNLGETERRNLAGILCRLQSMHLRRTAQHFDEELRALLDSLKALREDAGALCQDSGRFRQNDRGQSPFDQLSRDLDEAKGLLTRFSEAKTAVYDMIHRVADDVREMTLHVEEVRGIEVDIRIMGLNATLKCSRLGNKGKALAVIAQELRNCANRTQDQAKAVEDNLQGLIAAAHTLDASNARGSGAGMGETVQAMDRSLEDLRAAESEFLSRLDLFRRQGEAAQTLLAAAAKAIAEHPPLGEECRRLAQELESLAAAATEGMTDSRQLEEKARALLSGHYTMASERDIHDLFFGSGEPSAPVQEEAVTEADLDGVLF